MVPVTILIMVVSNIYLIIKNKKINLYALIPLIIVIIGTLVFGYFTLTRYMELKDKHFGVFSLEEFISKRKIVFFVMIIGMILYFIINKKKKIKSFKNMFIIFNLTYFLLSIIL